MSIGLGLDGPETTTEGDYTLGVSASGPLGADAEITVNWGDGFRTTDEGPGDYVHSLITSGWNYEGDVPLTDYTITAQAVARKQVSVTGSSFVNDAAVDSLGRRVTVGTLSGFWQVRRFAADGLPDGTFGNGGTVELNFGGGAYAVAVDASDRIIVGGQNSFNQFRVARLNASNGSLDGSFAVGGVATVPFGADSRVSAIAIQSDGKIVAAGNSGAGGFGDFVVARFHGAAGGVTPNTYQAGDLDVSFDGDGTAIQTVGNLSSLNDVAVGGNGRIVTAGTRHTGGDSAGAVVTFTSGGAGNGTYFVDAIPGNELVNAVAVGGDGSILLGGTGVLAGRGAAVLTKLTPTGTLDPAFGGGDGAVIYNYQPLGSGVTFDAQVRSVIIRDDLSIVAGGTLVNSTLNGTFGGFEGLALFGFQADGDQDLAFDGDAADDGVVYVEANAGVFGGQVSLVGETLIQSGAVQNGSAIDALGVYVETATFAVAVTNLLPTALFAPTDTVGEGEFVPPSNLPTAVPGQVAAFAFETTDPSLTDFGFLTYQIDWGDGTTETFSSGGTYFPADGSLTDFPLYVGHAFEASGNLTVKLTVTDEDGESSNVATFGVNVAATSGIVADPVNPGMTVLYYAAPANRLANKINVSSATSSTSITLDGATVFFNANPVDRVVVYGNYGDDTIQVNGATSAAMMEFYGGPGTDKLKGGNKADVLVGGAGDDMVVGGVGRDLLVGGFGEDKVVGDADDDILIGGEYVGAGSREAIAAVVAEWTSANTYTQRVFNLRHGVNSPNGFGPYGLVGYETAQEMSETFGQLVQNVFDDESVDKLTGDAGTDWFFANVDGSAIDKITDVLSPEFTDADREFIA